MELNFLKTNTPDLEIAVSVGSVLINSDNGTGGYFLPPHDQFAKFELLSPAGNIVQPIWGESSMERDWPQRIAVKLYPAIKVGPFAGEFWFVSNGSPFSLARYRLKDVYSITNEGDYTLIVRPVLYKNLTGKKIDISGGNFHQSNTNCFDRVDLPRVTAKIHLIPSQK